MVVHERIHELQIILQIICCIHKNLENSWIQTAFFFFDTLVTRSWHPLFFRNGNYYFIASKFNFANMITLIQLLFFSRWDSPENRFRRNSQLKFSFSLLAHIMPSFLTPWFLSLYGFRWITVLPIFFYYYF